MNQNLFNLIIQHKQEVIQEELKILVVLTFATPGQLGQAAHQMTGTIGSFLFLRDEDLGKIRPRWFES